VIAVAAALALPAAALAQTPPVPPAPTPTPVPTPVPPVQVQGKLKLKIEKTYRDDGRHVALTKQAWRIRGELRPYVAGQTVLVRLFRDGMQIHQQTE
jgi:hypothetical protein